MARFLLNSKKNKECHNKNPSEKTLEKKMNYKQMKSQMKKKKSYKLLIEMIKFKVNRMPKCSGEEKAKIKEVILETIVTNWDCIKPNKKVCELEKDLEDFKNYFPILEVTVTPPQGPLKYAINQRAVEIYVSICNGNQLVDKDFNEKYGCFISDYYPLPAIGGAIGSGKFHIREKVYDNLFSWINSEIKKHTDKKSLKYGLNDKKETSIKDIIEILYEGAEKGIYEKWKFEKVLDECVSRRDIGMIVDEIKICQKKMLKHELYKIKNEKNRLISISYEIKKYIKNNKNNIVQ